MLLFNRALQLARLKPHSVIRNQEKAMSTLTIKDLFSLDVEEQGEQTTTIRSLSREELRRISGGRSAVGMLNGDENNLVSFDIDKWNFDQFAHGKL
jgi:hypothetical protein